MYPFRHRHLVIYIEQSYQEVRIGCSWLCAGARYI
jgi:hypothetical protein